MNDDRAMRQVSFERVFEDNHERLGLEWIAGRQGGKEGRVHGPLPSAQGHVLLGVLRARGRKQGQPRLRAAHLGLRRRLAAARC